MSNVMMGACAIDCACGSASGAVVALEIRLRWFFGGGARATPAGAPALEVFE